MDTKEAELIKQIGPNKYDAYKGVKTEILRALSDFSTTHPDAFNFLVGWLNKSAETSVNIMMSPESMIKQKAAGRDYSYWQGRIKESTMLSAVLKNAKPELTHRLAYRAACEQTAQPA